MASSDDKKAVSAENVRTLRAAVASLDKLFEGNTTSASVPTASEYDLLLVTIKTSFGLNNFHFQSIIDAKTPGNYFCGYWTNVNAIKFDGTTLSTDSGYNGGMAIEKVYGIRNGGGA